MPLDTKFHGTWELDITQTTGMEEFGTAMGFKEDQIKLYSTLNYSFILSVDGDTVKLEVDFKGLIANSAYELKEGETIDYTSPDGRKSKLTVTVEDGNPTETYEITEKSIKWTVTRTVEGDVMTAITTLGTTSMTQVLKRVTE